MANRSFPSIDWCVVSFVKESELRESDILDFFTEMNKSLYERSVGSGLVALNFSPSPLFVELIAKAGYDYRSVRHMLSQTRNNFPNCLVVYSVLPNFNSVEHGWIKQLSAELGFVRQSILKENLENHFKNCSASTNVVYDNIASWFTRRIGQLAYGPREYNPHTLRITKVNEYFVIRNSSKDD